MKTARTLAILVLALTAAQGLVISGEVPQAPSEEPQRPAVVAFVNVNVVPMDRERILAGQTVIVRGDRISEMGPVDAVDVPEGARRIDCRDKYLTPGLVDMHAHIVDNYQLTVFVANGVTTVRNMWGSDYHLKLREEINKGKLIGPTLFTTGPIINGNPPIRHGFVLAETPEQAAQVVTEHKKAGYDFIKVYHGLSAEVYDTIVKTAAKHEMPVVGHVPSAVGIEHALVAGQHSVEHLIGYHRFLEGSAHWRQIDETKIPYIARATREAGVWNCVTIFAPQTKLWMGREEREQELKRAYWKYVSPFRKQAWSWRWQSIDPEPNGNLKVSNMMRVTKALHDARARILIGTDIKQMTGFAVHQELRNLVNAGLTPYEAIKAGTRNAAECLGELEEFGTISAGLRADLILIEANPLVDVGNAARRIGVMLRGRWFPQSKLQAMLDALAIKFTTEENPGGVMLRGRWYPRSVLEAMADAQNEGQKEELVKAVLSSDRIFLAGTSTSESVARSAVMKLIQVGLQAYVAGDVTSPEIEKGDLLIAISRTGESKTTCKIASAAKNAGARVVLLTSTGTSGFTDNPTIIGGNFRSGFSHRS